MTTTRDCFTDQEYVHLLDKHGGSHVSVNAFGRVIVHRQDGTTLGVGWLEQIRRQVELEIITAERDRLREACHRLVKQWREDSRHETEDDGVGSILSAAEELDDLLKGTT